MKKLSNILIAKLAFYFIINIGGIVLSFSSHRTDFQFTGVVVLIFGILQSLLAIDKALENANKLGRDEIKNIFKRGN